MEGRRDARQVKSGNEGSSGPDTGEEGGRSDAQQRTSGKALRRNRDSNTSDSVSTDVEAKTFTMRYCTGGICKDYILPADTVWDVVARADVKFGVTEDKQRWARLKAKWKL